MLSHAFQVHRSVPCIFCPGDEDGRVQLRSYRELNRHRDRYHFDTSYKHYRLDSRIFVISTSKKSPESTPKLLDDAPKLELELFDHNPEEIRVHQFCSMVSDDDNDGEEKLRGGGGGGLDDSLEEFHGFEALEVDMEEEVTTDHERSSFSIEITDIRSPPSCSPFRSGANCDGFQDFNDNDDDASSVQVGDHAVWISDPEGCQLWKGNGSSRQIQIKIPKVTKSEIERWAAGAGNKSAEGVKSVSKKRKRILSPRTQALKTAKRCKRAPGSYEMAAVRQEEELNEDELEPNKGKTITTKQRILKSSKEKEERNLDYQRNKRSSFIKGQAGDFVDGKYVRKIFRGVSYLTPLDPRERARLETVYGCQF